MTPRGRIRESHEQAQKGAKHDEEKFEINFENLRETNLSDSTGINT
jgi:hypothetical protein